MEDRNAQPALLLCNRKDTCAILGGISIRHLENLIAWKKLTPVRIGRRVMFRYKDLQAFVR